MIKEYTFFSPEMHCSACEIIVERALKSQQDVLLARANAAFSTVLVKGHFDEGPDALAIRFSGLLESKGYRILTRFPPPKRSLRTVKDFAVALLFASAVIAGFIALQRTGLVSLYNPKQMNLAASFLIGIIASLSSCMAIVGGLLLSFAANRSKASPSTRLIENVMFHASRIVSFFLLGGVIGAIGRAFTLSLPMSIALNVAVALVMLILGLNLLDIFPALKRLQPRLPASLSRGLLKAEKMRHRLTPALLGLITFFLPCGFTQSMQLFSLSTGSFLSGALTMGAFAVGTLPVLALISTASVNLSGSPRSGIFFKTAGLVVIAFALVNVLNALATTGLIRPLLGI